MSTWLNTFLNQPSAAEPWSTIGSRSLYCIIDTVRQPRALEQLYQQDGISDIDRLFRNTPFVEMSDVSPLWLPLKPGSPVAAKAVELCLNNRSGLLLSCSAMPEAAFSHAQRLLRMNCRQQGEALARYYDPAFWAALALTTSAHRLYGPWDSVFTPPAHPSDRAWRIWAQPAQTDEYSAAHDQPLLLDDSTLTAAEGTRWWYWVRAREAESAQTLRDEQLPTVFDNLGLLIEQGIDEGRHLERLLPLLSQCAWRERPEIMSVLSSNLPPFEKVQRLEV